MLMQSMHMHKFESLYLIYGVKGQSEVIWGQKGQILTFLQKCIISYMLHNISVVLMHLFETLYYFFDCQLGIIWVIFH